MTRPARGRRRRPRDIAEGEPPPGDRDLHPGDPDSVARTICLGLLTMRARSRAELADALAARDVPEDAATRVLDRFAEVGLIDDAALAASLAGAQHRERGLARRAVAVKLRQRGLADELDEALSGIDADSERSRARELVERRRRALAALPPEVQARRLVSLLARKGYPSGMAYAVVREALAGAVDWDTDGAADDSAGEPAADSAVST